MFNCEECGSCCKNLDKSQLYENLDRGDGTCIYLKNNKCSIYTERPILCRVDKSYEVYFSKIYDIEEYYQLNKKACNYLKSKEN